MIRWYAVHTHPKAEAKAQTHLRRQGFDTYLPLTARRRPQAGAQTGGRIGGRAGGQTAARALRPAAPLFPCYLFTALDLERDRWRAVRSTVGVRHLISCGGDEPAAVPDGVIPALRARENAEGVIEFEGELQTGDKVTVTEGLFADFTGRLADMPDDRRVTVLLNILGRETRAAVPRAQVRPAA